MPAREKAQSADELLAGVSAYLSDDLSQVNQLIDTALQSQIGLTNQITHHLQGSSGKRLRPMLTLLASRLGGEQVEQARFAAALVELLHVASLLHDDVIDHATVRRGQLTVNVRWGNEAAILVADYIYSHAFTTALDYLPPALLSVLTRTAADMCDGEMFQIEKRDQLLTEQDYYFIIQRKTARLFSACTRLGASLASLSDAAVGALERYGFQLGCAFQITDDVLDLVGDRSRLGKDIGTDVGCGKQTLPFIYALGKASAEDRAFLIAALSDATPPALVAERVDRYGGIAYALEAAYREAEQARRCLDEIPERPAGAFLRDLTELVVNRTR